MSEIVHANPEIASGFRAPYFNANFAAAAGLILFTAAWTIHGAIVASGKSLHYDLLEAYAWGKEFQLGYHQHGPFWAWIAGGWFLVFPENNSSFVFLEAINAAIGLLGAWRLIGLFAQGRTRHAATLLLAVTPFYTFLAFKYNANTIFVSLWAWTLFYFVRSLDKLKLSDAILFGVFSAACILSKYYSVILLMTCAFSLLFHPNCRRYILSPLPWTAAGVFAILVLPHAVWCLKSDAPPVAYALGLTGKGWLFSVKFAGKFIADAIVYQCGVAAVLLLCRWLSRATPAAEKSILLTGSRRRFLAVLVLMPPVLTIMFGLIFQLKILIIMAVGIFPLMPLFLMQFAGPLDEMRCFKVAAAAAITVTALAVIAAPFEEAIMIRKGGSSVSEPREELAARVTELWRAETKTHLRYAGGIAPVANGISFYSEDHPSSLVDLDYSKALWVSPEKIRKRGLLIACEHKDTGCLSKAQALLSSSSKQMSMDVERKIGERKFPPVLFDIFIIPPQAG